MAEDTSEESAIVVDAISKSFRLPHQKQSSLKGLFLSSFTRKTYEKQHAFTNISLDIKKGEFFGIVGRNGSGKSTLLKCIAGVYVPEKGSIKINGSMVPFIELGVGFNPELSGRDNVFLNGALLGMNRKKVEAMYDEIVSFAELENFMDQKLKNYSSGMQVRLAFSIAIRAHADILLLDEVLAVGDAAFQQKCFDYFETLKREKRTIVLVSHSMSTVEKFCDRAMLLEDGKIQKMGSSEEVANLYNEMFLKEEVKQRKEKRQQRHDITEKSKYDALVIKKTTIKQGNKTVTTIKAHEKFQIVIDVESTGEISSGNMRLSIKNRQGMLIADVSSSRTSGPFSMAKGAKARFTFTIDNIFNEGVYFVIASTADIRPSGNEQLNFKRVIAEFGVVGVKEDREGLVHIKADVSFDRVSK